MILWGFHYWHKKYRRLVGGHSADTQQSQTDSQCTFETGSQWMICCIACSEMPYRRLSSARVRLLEQNDLKQARGSHYKVGREL